MLFKIHLGMALPTDQFIALKQKPSWIQRSTPHSPYESIRSGKDRAGVSGNSQSARHIATSGSAMVTRLCRRSG